MLYLMNTKTTVLTDQPEGNEFGHDRTGAHGTVFVYLVNAETGKGAKVMATYGEAPAVGSVHAATQDTGLGHRKMQDQQVVAVKVDGVVTGTLPRGTVSHGLSRVAFWVAK